MTAESHFPPERRAEATARCAAASPGPWCAGYRGNGPKRILRVNADGYSASSAQSNYRRIIMTSANRFFIAHARLDLPDAIAEIERLERVVAELRAR